VPVSDSAFTFLLLPGLFIGVLVFVEIGRRLRMQPVAEETERERVVLNTIETAIYALLGLMVAFTFSGAASRFDARRALTVKEANAIGTAYLRLELLPAAAQPPLREKFRQYTELRIAVYQSLPDIEASNTNATRASALQSEIWTDAVAALKDAQPASTLLLLPALNDMIDITTTRAIMLKTHTPPIVLAALLVLALVCSLLIGKGLARKGAIAVVLHTVVFALVLTIIMYVIFDLDHPRVGLIRLDYADQALTEVLAGMK
jgi:hypothetical protein